MVMSLAYGFVLVWVGCFVACLRGEFLVGWVFLMCWLLCLVWVFRCFAPGVFGVCVIGWWLFWVLFGLVCINLVGAYVGWFCFGCFGCVLGLRCGF